MNWLDWVIIILVVYSTFQGLRYGLFLSLARLAGVLAGLFAAYAYYQPFSLYLVEHWRVNEKIFPVVREIFKSWIPVQSLIPPLPGKAALFSPLDLLGKTALPGGEALLRVISNTIVEAAGFMIIFFTVSMVINIAGLLLTRAAGFSLLGPVNHLGGLVFGLLRGIAYVFLLLLILSPFQRTGAGTGTAPGAPPIAYGKAFHDSKLYPFFEPLLKTGAPELNLPPLKGKDTTV